MSDSSDTDNPNIEWKKNKSTPNTKNSRRIDEEKLQQSQQKLDKHKIVQNNFTEGLRKIRKNIKDVYDDEDEDEDEYFQFVPNALNPDSNPLYNALDEEEKKILAQQKKSQLDMRLQDKAVKLGALQNAEIITKQTTQKSIHKAFAAKMMNQISANPQEIVQKTLNKEVVAKFKLKNKPGGMLSVKQLNDFCMGVKRIQAVGGSKNAVQGLRIEQVKKAGKTRTSDKKIAHMLEEKNKKSALKSALKKIWKKSGRDTQKKKKPLVKNSSRSAQKKFNKLLTEQTMMKQLGK